MSTFGDQVFQFGGVPVTSSLPFFNGGDTYFVDPKRGSDGNSGKRPDKAVASVNQAYTLCRDGYNDVVILMSPGETASSDCTTYLTSTLTWAKDRCHLIGAAAPVGISPRARISTSGTTAIDAALEITGQGSIFANFQVYAGLDAAVSANAIEVTGQRNYFWRVHAAGIGNAKNDVANAYSLKLNGGGENLFEECVVGIDTIGRGSHANSELMLAGSTARNRFVRCNFRTLADAAGHQFILAGAAAIERECSFEGCIFHNPEDTTSAVEMTEAIDINASQNGILILKDCTLIGVADWEAGDAGLSYIDGAAPTNNTSGIAVATAA